MVYKRKRVYAPRRAPYKRRRYGGKSRRRPRRSYGFTSKSGRPGVLPTYGGKKLRPRAYRSALWKKSLFDSKYNYTDDTSGTLQSSLLLTDMKYYVVDMLPHITDPAYWRNHNGTTNPTGIIGRITLRGGYSSLQISSEDLEEQLEYKIYACWVRVTSLDVGLHPRSWDPFHKDANNEEVKVLKTWNGFLDGMSSTKVVWRHRIRTIDPWEYTDQNYKMVWYIALGLTHDAEATTPKVVNYITSQNCSVCADVTVAA